MSEIADKCDEGDESDEVTRDDRATEAAISAIRRFVEGELWAAVIIVPGRN